MDSKLKNASAGRRGRVDLACSVFNSKLIVTGGGEIYQSPSDTTVILDLSGGPGTYWVEGGRLHSARYGHAMMKLELASQERLLVIDGSEWNSCDDHHVCVGNTDIVEVWNEESRSWEEERLLEGRKYMGAVAGTRGSVCLVWTK